MTGVLHLIGDNGVYVYPNHW